MKYYDMTKLLKVGKHAKYKVCFGERSNGKTWQVIYYGLKKFIQTGGQMAILRRWQEDFKGKRAATYFDSLVCDGNGVNHIKELTKGKFDRVTYYAGRWFLAYWDEDNNKPITDSEPFAYAFALSNMEHEKGNSYPNIMTIFFDEFMTRGVYLPDEFILFMNSISTIVRARDNVEVFMAANTVSLYGNPYFKEMMIADKVKNMQKGEIRLFKYGDTKLEVAVEYCDSPNTFKPSDVYFAFKSSDKLNMITSGAWEFDFYPHLTTEFNKHDIKFSYFVIYEDQTLQADIVILNNDTFTFIHRKTTPIQDEEKDIVFTTEAISKNNYLGRLTKPSTGIGKKILWFFVNNKVFYQDNEIGEIMNRYINWSNNLQK